MELGGLSFFTSNPILVVTLVMDVGMGAQLVRSMLHPYVGNFDIALVLQPLTINEKNAKAGIPPPQGGQPNGHFPNPGGI